MDPLTILAWLGVVIAACIVLTIVTVVVIVIAGTILGLRKMRDNEDKPEQSIFKSGGDR